jgi:type IV pilus assembly protein PilN
MLRINLLPRKASKKQTTAKNELYIVAASIILIILGVYLAYWYRGREVDALDARIATAQQEVESLKKDVVRVEEFKKKTATLEQKLQVIEKLKKQKVGPAHMLDDLATILTEEPKVWLTKMGERDGVMSLEGEAMEHSNISDFQLALQRRSKFFRDVKLELVETKTRDGVNILAWKITCQADYAAG